MIALYLKNNSYAPKLYEHGKEVYCLWTSQEDDLGWTDGISKKISPSMSKLIRWQMENL